MWRPTIPVISNHPLGFCDARTVIPEQLVACDRILRNRRGELYLMQHRADNKWYWLEHQKSSEPILILTWDSGVDVEAQCKSCLMP